MKAKKEKAILVSYSLFHEQSHLTRHVLYFIRDINPESTSWYQIDTEVNCHAIAMQFLLHIHLWEATIAKWL